MKKLSIVLLAVLLIASLIISCDNSTKALTDELVEVQLGTQAGSRALSSSVTLEQISDSSLKWFYSASKETQLDFATGETERAFIRLGDTKTFSQGKWTFILWAEQGAVVDAAGNTTTAGTKVYEGKLEHVLITKSSSPVPVVISVSPYVLGVNGSVKFNDVMIKKHNSDNYVEANRVSVNGEPVTLTHGDSSVISLPAGSHTAIVSYVGDDTVTYAYEEIAFTVYSGRTTTINGFVGEDTATGEITAIATAAKVEKNVNVVTDGDTKKSALTTFTAPVNPAGDKTQNTTVTFPQGALPVKADGTASTVNLSVETKNVDSNFSASGVADNDKKVVSGIDLKVTVNGSNVTKFNDQTVEVTTFIAKGLSNVVVYYNRAALGTGSYTYESDTGALTIRTTHFSEFLVAATPFEALNTRTNKASTLSDAITEAQNGDTIKLYNDVTSSSMITIEKANLILDLNGKIIKNNNTNRDYGTTIKNKGTLTIKDSIGSGNVVSDKNVAISVGDNSVTTIESGTYQGQEGAVITGYATGATININGGTFTATDNAVIAGNGTNREGNANEINITDGTFTGGITTPNYVACGIYAPWKDNINVSGGTFNITGGAGIVARAGYVNVSGGTFTCTGTTKGKVGDSRVVVPCSAFVFDSDANYPALTADSKITVTGGTFTSEVNSINVIPAGSDVNTRIDVSISVSNSDQAQAAIMMNVKDQSSTSAKNIINITCKDDIVLDLNKDGDYYTATLGNKDSQSVTINANEKKITFDSEYRNAINCYGELTINDATIDSTYNTSGSTWDDYGLIFRYQNGGKNEVVFNNVVFNRQVVIEKGVKATFNHCTINQTSATGDMYALWICAGADVTLNGCTINSMNPNDGRLNRAIKIADEYITNPQLTKLNVSGTTIISQKKAAVLVTSTAGANITWGEGNNIDRVSADSTNAVWNDSDRTSAWDLVTVTGCKKLQEQ